MPAVLNFLTKFFWDYFHLYQIRYEIHIKAWNCNILKIKTNLIKILHIRKSTKTYPTADRIFSAIVYLVAS